MTTDLTTRPDLIPTKRQMIRKWVLRLAMLLAVLGPLIYICAALGHKVGLLDLKTAFGTMSREIGPIVLLSSLGLGLISLILAYVIQPRKGFVVAILAMAIPLIGLGKANGIKNKAQSLPFIHDITTDTQDPPVFTDAIVQAREDSGARNTLEYIGKKDKEDGSLVSVLQTKAYPEIRPVLSEQEPAVVFGEALSLVKQQGWDIVTEDAETGIIEATDTTFWYGFKDDVIVRVRAAEGGGSIVDMRSISRVGMSDIGKNAERLGVLIKGLEKG